MAVTSLQRKPFPNFNTFRPFVFDEFKRRGTETNFTVAPFARLTSCKRDDKNNYKFFTLGLHGFSAAELDIFETTYGEGADVVGYGYSTKDIDSNGNFKKRLLRTDEISFRPISAVEREAFGETSANQLESQVKTQESKQRQILAGGADPIPGITSVNISRSGILEFIRANITIRCYNRLQMEFIRYHFMIAGSYVVLDWANVFANKVPSKMFNFGRSNAEDELVKILRGRKYTLENYVEPNDGNYDVLVGVVSNYTMNFEPRNRTYDINITVVATGELIAGISNQYTVIDTDNPEKKTQSIKDFFSGNGEFNRMINDPSAVENGDVAILKSDNYDKRAQEEANSTQTTPESTELSGFGQTPEDNSFVTWKYFTNTILPTIYKMLDRPGIVNLLHLYGQFGRDQNSLPEEERDYVGDNQFLKSTNPDALIIYKKKMLQLDAFSKTEYFGDGHRGLLQEGVWINANAIRRAFLNSNTLEASIEHLLTEMSNATENYWNLKLFYDDETGIYKIVDTKYGDLRQADSQVFYKFNRENNGECLEIELDSAFSSEMVAMMTMTARFASLPDDKKKFLLEKFPTAGTTSQAGFAMNWTNLVDIVQQKMIAEVDAKKQSAAQYEVVQAGTESGQALSRGADVLGATPHSMAPQGSDASQQAGYTVGEAPTVGPSQIGDEVQVKKAVAGNAIKPINSELVNRINSRSSQFDDLIEQKAKKYDIDPLLLKAVIWQESRFKVKADIYNPHMKQSAHGLMQLLPDTARGLGFEGEISELTRPDVNIEYGAALLSQNIKRTEGDVPAALSAYHGGWRPKYGLGYRFDGSSDEVTPCLQRDPQTGQCVWMGTRVIGQFGNQEYVNSIMSTYNQLRYSEGFGSYDLQSAQFQHSSGISIVPADATAVNTPPIEAIATDKTPKVGDQANLDDILYREPNSENQTLSENGKLIKQKISDLALRFGHSIFAVIELNTADMIKLITADGYDRPGIGNNFVAPFPTTTAVEVRVVGISGVSITDAFIVDKLPFIFEQYGIFQTVQLQDTIDRNGWTTKIRGYFKLLWMDGTGIKQERGNL